MDASLFLCTLRRFFTIGGPALRLRCDQGTNFVDAKTEIDQAQAEMDKESVARYLSEQGCEWFFNPPHASHFGGAWERQIGIIRRILDAMLLELGTSQLTHELLVTLMSEVAAIPSDHGHTFRHRQTSNIVTNYVAGTKDAPTWTPPRKLYRGRPIRPTKVEKGSISCGPVLDQMET